MSSHYSHLVMQRFCQWVVRLLFIVLSMEHVVAAKAFNCPSDGHFPDEDDCSRFYQCANDRAMANMCPAGLFFNPATEHCDWPEMVDCDFSIEKARLLKVEKPTFVYLTFDDGPKEGTREVLHALKEAKVPATFFINSRNLMPDRSEKSKSTSKIREEAVDNALTMIESVMDGHVLGDHSFDHMFHNSESSSNAYVDVKEDLKYFGDWNAFPVTSILSHSKFDQELVAKVNSSMHTLIRMPYSNNWRVRMADGGSNIVADCPTCTVPRSSGSNGIIMADIMAGRAQIYGWDIEWRTNWGTNRLGHGGLQMFMRLRGARGKRSNKIVLLAHDVAFRPNEISGDTGAKRELDTFLELAKNAGFVFRTIDTYHSD